MKALAFAFGLFISAVGVLGIVAPSALVWIAYRATSPAQLYFIGAVRIGFGILLLSVKAGVER